MIHFCSKLRFLQNPKRLQRGICINEKTCIKITLKNEQEWHVIQENTRIQWTWGRSARSTPDCRDSGAGRRELVELCLDDVYSYITFAAEHNLHSYVLSPHVYSCHYRDWTYREIQTYRKSKAWMEICQSKVQTIVDTTTNRGFLNVHQFWHKIHGKNV